MLHAFIYTGWIGDGREETHRKYKVHILIVACLQCSDAGQKCFKILRIFNFGVQLWLTRTRSDLVTAQVDRPIILESTLNDSALYLQAFVDLPVWWTPSEYDILTRKLPDFNEIVPKFDRLLWISCACPCLHIYRGIGDGREGRHRKYKVHILNGCLPTVLRCRSKMF